MLETINVEDESSVRVRSVTSNAARDDEVRQQLHRMTRRSFATGTVAALGGTVGLWWLKAAQLEDGIPWPLRRVLQFNERVTQAYYRPGRLAPTFDPSRAMEPRVNGMLGLRTDFDPRSWRLDVLSPGAVVERSLPISAIHQLPRFEMVTEFKCVEGWSQIVQWAGARLADFISKYGHDTPFVGLATPDRQYYVGLDRASALHSQSLLAYEMNGQPLTADHGAPLRLVCPLKYGVKSIKRIGAIHFTHNQPADYWAERGYDWYLGH
jgi:DMSO/TMAO reductase YedYZ molybdopterin-dependent catalytic subunit